VSTDPNPTPLPEAERQRYIAQAAELGAEIERLRKQVGELQGILIDNIHDVRTALHGSSSALPCSPREAHKLTVQEVERLRKRSDELQTLAVEATVKYGKSVLDKSYRVDL